MAYDFDKEGIGGLGSRLLGGRNAFEAKGPQLDPNAYQYGGQQGGADEAANRYRQQAEGAQGRQATQAQNVNVDYGQANQARSQGMQARQGQAALASAMYGRASGQTPSIAQMQADRQMGQAAASQARPPSGPGSAAWSPGTPSRRAAPVSRVPPRSSAPAAH